VTIGTGRGTRSCIDENPFATSALERTIEKMLSSVNVLTMLLPKMYCGIRAILAENAHFAASPFPEIGL
jgi:hypothetical protein